MISNTKISFTNKEKGFTIVELLVVVMVLAVLLVITLVAINPGKQFAKGNNTKRRSGVTAILKAVEQYANNKSGISNLNIPVGSASIINSSGQPNTVDICYNLTPTFITRLPVDPRTGSWINCQNYDTRYTIMKDINGRVTVSAADSELEENISVIQ